MATSRLITHPQKGVYVATWASLVDGDVGDAADIPLYCANRSVQVSGTPGATLSFSLEGSNDGTNWGILNDNEGNPITIVHGALTRALVFSIMENTIYVRTSEIIGDGSSNVRVVLAAA